MNYFKDTSRQLSLAIRHKKSTLMSLWHYKRWRDLFEEVPRGLGVIKPAVAAYYFPNSALQVLEEGRGDLKEFTPVELENKLCEKYRDYKSKGFWRRLWMRITQPIDTYRQTYILITLRDLQKQYSATGDTFSQISGVLPLDIDKWSNYFSQAIAGHSASLRCCLPTEVSLFSRLFYREDAYRYVYELQQFKTDIAKVLKEEVDASYVALFKRAESCPPDKKQHLKEQMTRWFESHANSINENNAGLNPFWEQEYGDLLATLTIKYKLLLCLVTSAPCFEDLPKDIDKSFVEDKKFEQLDAKQAIFEQGCHVQTDGKPCVSNHTYIVRRNLFLQWEVMYVATPKEIPVPVDMGKFPGLKTILQQTPEDSDAIKQAIISGHQKGAFLNTDYGREWCEEIEKASADKQEEILLADFSQQLEEELLKQSIIKENQLKEAIKKLQAYRDSMAKKNEAWIAKQKKLESHAESYKKLSADCRVKAEKIKMHHMNLMVFANGNQEAALSSSFKKLLSYYETLYSKESFLMLSPMLQNALKKETAGHIATIEQSMFVLRSIKNPEFKDKVNEFFDVYSNAPWIEEIEAYFIKAEEGCSDDTYSGAFQRLQDTAKSCFQDYVLQTPCNYSELRSIYVHIEKIRQEYLYRIQKQSRTLVLVPSDEQFKPMPNQRLQEKLECSPSYLEYFIAELSREFQETLNEPVQHGNIAWITMAKKPTVETLKTLPVVFNPAYIYVNEPTKCKTLYFVNKDTSLIEEIHLTKEVTDLLDTEFSSQVSGSRLSQEQTVRITALTNHSYDRKIYQFSILLEALVYRLEGVLWGLLESNVLFDKRCGLMRASKEQFEKIKKTLLWSHYIITPDNELYYYCKQENTLEQHSFLDEKLLDMFQMKFPGNHYGYCPQLDSNQIGQIYNAILYKRDEDRRITTKQVCDMTKREISQLFRAISLLYHSDKHPDYEALQKFIGEKKANADANIDGMLMLQEDLIDKYGLLRKNLKQAPWEISSFFVPGWIRKHLNPDVAATQYCRYIRSDKEIDDWNKYSKAENESDLIEERKLIKERKSMDEQKLIHERELMERQKLIDERDLELRERQKVIDERERKLLERQKLNDGKVDDGSEYIKPPRNYEEGMALLKQMFKDIEVLKAERNRQSESGAALNSKPDGLAGNDQPGFFSTKSVELTKDVEVHTYSK